MSSILPGKDQIQDIISDPSRPIGDKVSGVAIIGLLHGVGKIPPVPLGTVIQSILVPFHKWLDKFAKFPIYSANRRPVPVPQLTNEQIHARYLAHLDEQIKLHPFGWAHSRDPQGLTYLSMDDVRIQRALDAGYTLRPEVCEKFGVKFDGSCYTEEEQLLLLEKEVIHTIVDELHVDHPLLSTSLQFASSLFDSVYDDSVEIIDP